MSTDTAFWIVACVAMVFCLPLRRFHAGILFLASMVSRGLAFLGVAGLGSLAVFPNALTPLAEMLPEAWLATWADVQPRLPSPAVLAAYLGVGGFVSSLSFDFARSLLRQRTEMKSLSLLLRQHHLVLLQTRKPIASPEANGYHPVITSTAKPEPTTLRRRLGELFLPAE